MSSKKAPLPVKKPISESQKKEVPKEDFEPETLEYPVSMNGLKEWYHAVFEKLGWMILANRDERQTKLASYKEGLLRLREALEEKLTYIDDADDKKDIKIYHYNLSTLINHVEKDFNGLPKSLSNRPHSKQAGGSSKSLKKNKSRKNKNRSIKKN
jgi:hypothetical protein